MITIGDLVRYVGHVNKLKDQIGKVDSFDLFNGIRAVWVDFPEYETLLAVPLTDLEVLYTL